MKTLCECVSAKERDVCSACYMANLEDWSNIHAIAMSTEAERRLQEDLRFLESVNVWHLVNLRSAQPPPPPPPPPALYPPTPAERLDVISGSMSQLERAYSQSSYGGYMDASPQYHKHLYSNTPTGQSAVSPPVSAGIGTSLPYPDLIMQAHAKDMLNPHYHRPTGGVKPQQYYYNYPPPPGELQENAPPSPTPSPQPPEPEDYDAEERGESPDEKKSVTFTADTVFVERDMESPFWRAFTERRRLRRINRQKKHVAQVAASNASSTYTPSLLEMLKSAFTKKDSNGNNTSPTKKHSRGEPGGKVKGEQVLMYDNNSQLQYHVYGGGGVCSRSHKLLQMMGCQCCASEGHAHSSPSKSTAI